VVWRLVRTAARRHPPDDGREAQFVADELAGVARLGAVDDVGSSNSSGCLTFPFLASSIAYTMTHVMVGFLLVTPFMAAMWRRRRLLADATAVELTRNPDALVAAFQHMEDRAPHVPAGPWTHLFLIGPEVRRGRAKRRLDQRMEELRADQRRPGESRTAAVRRKVGESMAAQREYQQALDEGRAGTAGTAADDDLLRSGLDHFIPPMDQRLERLGAMGAQLRTDPGTTVTRRRPRPATPAGWIGRALAWAVGGLVGVVLLALMAFCGVMIVVLLASLTYLALMFQLLLVMLPVLLAHALLR
jgi:hypothetical protein